MNSKAEPGQRTIADQEGRAEVRRLFSRVGIPSTLAVAMQRACTVCMGPGLEPQYSKHSKTINEQKRMGIPEMLMGEDTCFHFLFVPFLL